ncbi:hypothetical protein E2C01_099446 [Portunus trituberculatus]|uniref:Uncharacterized protein n=1 Tax=Portunus trituberculatus TaxID=210409 RepID=A0A5B7K0D5_PORTR|nr:hypothetical protein [Portunus trituberculatus]
MPAEWTRREEEKEAAARTKGGTEREGGRREGCKGHQLNSAPQPTTTTTTKAREVTAVTGLNADLI